MMEILLHDLPRNAAQRDAAHVALCYGDASLNYGELWRAIESFAGGLLQLGVARGERVAIFLEKRFETVIASFGTAAAGAVFVPVNPLLKAEQVAYILRDCNVRVLITSSGRLPLLREELAQCRDLRHVVVCGDEPIEDVANAAMHGWDAVLDAPRRAGHRVIDTDVLAILYTSGSTGKPKGVVLSHRNMVCGAQSVASYLENSADDTLLAALPL